MLLRLLLVGAVCGVEGWKDHGRWKIQGGSQADLTFAHTQLLRQASRPAPPTPPPSPPSLRATQSQPRLSTWTQPAASAETKRRKKSPATTNPRAPPVNSPALLTTSKSYRHLRLPPGPPPPPPLPTGP